MLRGRESAWGRWRRRESGAVAIGTKTIEHDYDEDEDDCNEMRAANMNKFQYYTEILINIVTQTQHASRVYVCVCGPSQ